MPIVEAVMKGGQVRESAAQAGTTYNAVWYHASKDPEFAFVMQSALWLGRVAPLSVEMNRADARDLVGFGEQVTMRVLGEWL